MFGILIWFSKSCKHHINEQNIEHLFGLDQRFGLTRFRLLAGFETTFPRHSNKNYASSR